MGREFTLLAYRVVFRTPQTKAAHMVYRTYSDKYEECNPVIDAVTDYIADRYIAREDKADDPSPTTRSAHGKEDLVPPAGMSRATFERASYTEPDLRFDSQSPHMNSRSQHMVVPGLKYGGFGFAKQREKSASAGIVFSKPVVSLPSKPARENSLANDTYSSCPDTEYASVETLERPKLNV